MLLLAVHVYALLVTQTHKAPVHHASPKTESASVRKFVQSFYDWYTPRALKTDAEPLALKVKAAMFTPELRRALQEDRVASSKNKDEIVGLDFDPFLASQDPYPTYTVVNVEKRGKSWLASVAGSSPTDKTTLPSVVAEVARYKQGWRFTNFIYSEESNLLDTLRQLKKDREH